MFEQVTLFENKIAEFFGAPFAVATDCCTHAIELCLRYLNSDNISFPSRTYLSIPMLGDKLKINWSWNEDHWEKYYNISNTPIYDAATLWEKGSYIPGTFMCISFQFKKHLSLGRGGVILCDKKQDYEELVKLSYDGRHRGPAWPSIDITSVGYHYYMTPETAAMGLSKLESAINTVPKIWNYTDYPDIRKNTLWKKNEITYNK